MSNSIIFKTFRTYAHPYVYDRHTNAVVMLTEDEYKELVEVEKGTLATDDSTVVRRYQEQGLFQPNVVQKIEHSGTSYLVPYLKNRMGQLTLQVTQQCNLRCEYCAYSGIYEKNRVHNSTRMSFDTAKRAIDYFLKHSRELDEITIGFYGGEPLLEFELIKKCVEYAKNKVEGQRIRFNMTTNGTLLSDKVVDYLVEEDFHISISLDGSQKEHDASRKFKDGRGSFNTIIANIQRIRDRYPDFDKRIQIMTTVNPNMDLGCVMEYFNTDEIFSDKNIMFNTMNEINLKDKPAYDDEYYLIRQFEYLKCLFALIGKVDERFVSPLTSRTMSEARKLKSRIHKHGAISRIAHHNGPCMPGVRKLFVRADGKFYPCERVNETQEYMCIGSIECGINATQCKNILNIGQLTESLCKKCWALNHCSMCIAQFEFEDEPTFADKVKCCNSMKMKVLADIREMCTLNEFGMKTEEMRLLK